MGIYSIAEYGVDKYGEAPRLAFSVAPFIATAIDYQSVSLTWSPPEGDIGQIRLVRSQDGYAETEEDGIILWEWDSVTTLPRIEAFVDSPENAPISLVSGRYAYYRIWIFEATLKRWRIAGDAVTVVPRAHDSVTPDGEVLVSTHDKFVDLLPRVFTSVTQSPLDVVDKNSDLYHFLKGFAFTADEIMTLADNVLPEESSQFINPELIGLKTQSLGLEQESYVSLKNQKRLIREAIYMHSNKGTRSAIETYAESLTGFAPIVTTSPNLLLSIQDSSFHKGLGNWIATGDAAITLEQTVIPPTEVQEPSAVDFSYTAKVVGTTAQYSIVNGVITPRVLGIPITAEATYSFSSWVNTEEESHSVKLKVHWYDYLGEAISSDASGLLSLTQSTWVKVVSSFTSPETASYVALELEFSGIGTAYVDMVQFSAGADVPYSEARSVNIFLNPKKTNELPDPSFSGLTGMWSINAASSERITPSTISWESLDSVMLRVVTNALSGTSIETTTAPVQGGKYYTFSIYAKMAGLQVLEASLENNIATVKFLGSPSWEPNQTINIRDFAGDGQFSIYNGDWVILTISGDTITFILEEADQLLTSASSEATICRPESMNLALLSVDTVTLEQTSSHESLLAPFTSDWQRYSVTGFVPSGANPQYLKVRVQGTTNGCVMDFDNAQLEASYLPTDYFDGDSPESYGAVWEGTPYESRSHIYPNKVIKTTRLAETLFRWLPINRAHTVSTYAGIEHKVLP
jgi:hypothetical protein